MATQLLAKFEENSSTAQTRSKVRNGLLEYFISQGPFLSFLEFPLLSCLFLSTLSFLFLSLPHCIRMRAHLIHLPLLPPPRSLFQMRMMTLMRKKRRGRREKTLVLQSPKTHPLPLLLLLFLLLTQNGRYASLSAVALYQRSCFSSGQPLSNRLETCTFLMNPPFLVLAPRLFFQPSIYLRLLEDPSSVAQQTCFLYSPKASFSQGDCSRSRSPSRSKSPLSPPRSPSPNVDEHCYPEHHFSASPLSSVDLPSQRSEDPVQQVNFVPQIYIYIFFSTTFAKTSITTSLSCLLFQL